MDCARNIITANFSGGGTSATTAPLWQWDYGQALCITGIDLPAAFEVHFSTNRTGGVSTVAVGADGQVTIPNVLLTIGKNLNAWIYLSDSKGEGETEYSILIPVKARPMPETYDAEVSGEFDDVVRQVSEYAETAQTAADNAGASASAAAASASEAAASASAAETAKTAAETAQGKAEDAQAAAKTAAQTATEKAQQTAQDAAQAAQSKADAESAAGRAEAAQTGAESAKTDAETAAQGAASSASAASASATSAGQAAISAGQSAAAAAQSAASIEGDVQIASQKAAEAQTAADQAVAAKDAAVAAQQGAEAAETNAGQSASTATAKASEAATSASNAAQSKTAAEAAATRAETAAASLTVDSALSETSENPVQNKVITGEITDVKSAIDALKIVDTASGAIASFSDGAAMPVESLTVEMSPIQEGTGDPSPDNIRPITGRDSVTVTRTGKNLFDKTTVVIGYIDDSDGQLKATQAGSLYRSTDFVSVVGGQSYYIKTEQTAAAWGAWYDANKQYISRQVQYINAVVTAPNNAKYLRLTIVSPITGNLDTFGINYPSTDHDYHAYNGTSVTLQLGQSVYGGTLDVTTGTMTVDRVMVTFDGSQPNNQFNFDSLQSYAPPRNRISWTLIYTIGAISGAYISDTLIGDTAYVSAPLIWHVSNSNAGVARMFIGVPSSITSVTDWQAYVTEHPISVVYKLATPQTIQLTPAQLSTLKGDNNVWSDADSVSVDYVVDPKLYIARLTEPDADMVADANITSGHYFMVGNTLYLATANIASGATIVPGVNCTRTNLASALNAINS